MCKFAQFADFSYDEEVRLLDRIDLLEYITKQGSIIIDPSDFQYICNTQNLGFITHSVTHNFTELGEALHFPVTQKNPAIFDILINCILRDFNGFDSFLSTLKVNNITAYDIQILNILLSKGASVDAVGSHAFSRDDVVLLGVAIRHGLKLFKYMRGIARVSMYTLVCIEGMFQRGEGIAPDHAIGPLSFLGVPPNKSTPYHYDGNLNTIAASYRQIWESDRLKTRIFHAAFIPPIADLIASYAFTSRP